MKNRLGALTAAAVALVLIFAPSAQAQGYPTKPIEIVCAWGPGIAIDMVSRLIADIGPKYLGQPMFVTDKAGATGSLATADVIASRPDGYKLFSNNHAYFATTIHTQKMPFDPRDLVPLANFVETRQGMAVQADSLSRLFTISSAMHGSIQASSSRPSRAGASRFTSPRCSFSRRKG